MRKAIILLVLFVILMVATLVWGVSRDRGPTAPVAEGNCNALPEKFNSKGKKVIDTDKLDTWKRNCVPKMGSGIADRFASGVELEPAELQVSGDALTWQVPRKKGNSAQQAVLRLVSGSLVGIRAEPVNEPGAPEDRRYGAQDQCLCQGTVTASEVRRMCSADWIGDVFEAASASRSHDNDSLGCPSGLNKRKLYFGPLGGTLTLTASGQARVSSK